MHTVIKVVLLAMVICSCACGNRTSSIVGPDDSNGSSLAEVAAVTITPLFDDYWYRFDTNNLRDPKSVESLAKLIMKGTIHKPAKQGFHAATIEYKSGKKASYYFVLSDGKGGVETSEAIEQSQVFVNEIFPKVQNLVINHLESRHLKSGAEPD